MAQIKATDFIRALDDSDLDVYETRYLMRVWRRGHCWERLKSIADTTGMSIGKASQVRKELLTKGWLLATVKDGRAGYEVSIPNCCIVSPSEDKFHEVKPEFHEVKPEFHDMSALPINRPKEDYNTKGNDLDELRDHFTNRTAIFPNDRTGRYERDWSEPLGKLLELAQGDAAAAAAMIDAALAIAWGKNGSGKVYPVASPRSILTIAVNLAAAGRSAVSAADDDSLWQRALQAVARRDYSDERLKAAIRAIGGSQAVANANGHNTETLRRKLAHEYRRNPATA